MIRRAALIFLLVASPASASPLDDAARLLDGEWQAGEHALRVDRERAQANVDPDRPFQWQRFEVKEVSDEEVVFAVGAEIFEAEINAEMLTLSSTSFRGERILMRQPDPVGPVTADALNLRGGLD